jgi:hypothetical protein
VYCDFSSLAIGSKHDAVQDALLEISRSSFVGNRAEAAGARGGALAFVGGGERQNSPASTTGHIQVSESVFSANHAGRGGAVYLRNTYLGSWFIGGASRALVFQNNYASLSGGAMYVEASESNECSGNCMTLSDTVVAQLLNAPGRLCQNHPQSVCSKAVELAGAFGERVSVGSDGSVPAFVQVMHNVRFENNYAGSTGGSVELSNAIAPFDNIYASRSNASEQGGFVNLLASSTVRVTDSKIFGARTNPTEGGKGGVASLTKGSHLSFVNSKLHSSPNGENPPEKCTAEVERQITSCASELVSSDSCLYNFHYANCLEAAKECVCSSPRKLALFQQQRDTFSFLECATKTNMSEPKPVDEVCSGVGVVGSALEGGAVYVAESATVLNLVNTTIEGFATENQEGTGGGIFVTTFAQVNIQDNSKILRSQATAGGALFATSSSTVHIAGSTLSGCTSLFEAAAIYMQRASVIVDDHSEISDNFCEGDGGGIYVDAGSNLKIEDTTLKRNAAARGGAIFIGRQSRLSIKRTSMTDNEATEDGGAIKGEDNYLGNFELTSVRFERNRASSSGMGGAVDLYRASATLDRCEFHHNIAGKGGAVSMRGFGDDSRRSKLYLEGDNTFAYNYASAPSRALGGALYMGDSAMYSAAFDSSAIFEGNMANAGGAVFTTGVTEGAFQNSEFRENVAESAYISAEIVSYKRRTGAESEFRPFWTETMTWAQARTELAELFGITPPARVHILSVVPAEVGGNVVTVNYRISTFNEEMQALADTMQNFTLTSEGEPPIPSMSRSSVTNSKTDINTQHGSGGAMYLEGYESMPLVVVRSGKIKMTGLSSTSIDPQQMRNSLAALCEVVPASRVRILSPAFTLSDGWSSDTIPTDDLVVQFEISTTNASHKALVLKMNTATADLETMRTAINNAGVQGALLESISKVSGQVEKMATAFVRTTTFTRNVAPGGRGGAVFFTFLRRDILDESYDIAFVNNDASGGRSVFWQFRGEKAPKKVERVTQEDIRKFHAGVKQMRGVNPDKLSEFLGTTAVTVHVATGLSVRQLKRGNVSALYKNWFKELDNITRDFKDTAGRTREQAIEAGRILYGGPIDTKSGWVIEDERQKKSRLVTRDFYGSVAMDMGSTYCSIVAAVPKATQFQVPTAESRFANFSYINYRSLNFKGDIGARVNVTFKCGNAESYLGPGTMGSIKYEVTIRPCDPGEELSGTKICEPCREGEYSLTGHRCLPCPEGGICKKRINSGSPAIYSGVDRPAVAPGYWLYKAPDWLLRRKDYCWDVDGKCRLDAKCAHGLCKYGYETPEDEAEDRKTCHELKEQPSAVRIHRCITGESFYRCPMDEIACRGGDRTELDSPPRHPALANSNGLRRQLASDNSSTYDIEVENPMSSKSRGDSTINGPACFTKTREALQRCTDTCNPGYEGIKCKSCRDNWFKAADHTCVTCGDADPGVSKALYGLGITCAMFVFFSILGLWLRDDSGTKYFGALCFPCLKCVEAIQRRKAGQRGCSCKRKGKRGTKTSVLPAGSAQALHKGTSSEKIVILRWEKLKIFLAWQQIFGQMKWNYNIRWPPVVATYMRLYAVFQLDILSLVPLDCLFRTDFYFGLVFSALLPAICLIMIFLLHAGGKTCYTRSLDRSPRKCVKSGKKLRGVWMPKTQAAALSKQLARAHLTEVFGAAKLTPQMVTNEVNEAHTPMLPYSTSYAPGLDENSEYTPEMSTASTRKAVLQFNEQAFKQRVKQRINHLKYVTKLWKIFFMLMLLAYPSVAMRVARFFACERIGSESYLSIDSRTPCYDDKHTAFTFVAVLNAILYVAGTPLLFISIIKKAREDGVKWKLQQCALLPQLERRLLIEAKTDANYSFEFWDEPSDAKEKKRAIVKYLRRMNLRMHNNVDKFGFIYESYSENVWWYEVVELFRKLSLNALIVLVAPNESAQVVIGLMICVFFLVTVQVVRPYESSTDNYLAFLAHLQLVLTLLCGLLIQHGEPMIGVNTEPDPKERKWMSEAILQWVVVLSHASVFFFFFFSLVEEMFFSKESALRARRNKLREQAIKASSRARSKFSKVKRKLTSGRSFKSGMIASSKKSNMQSFTHTAPGWDDPEPESVAPAPAPTPALAPSALKRSNTEIDLDAIMMGGDGANAMFAGAMEPVQYGGEDTTVDDASAPESAPAPTKPKKAKPKKRKMTRSTTEIML